MALRFGNDLDEEISSDEVDGIVAALKAQPDVPEPEPARPAPRRATRRKSTPAPEPTPDVSRETSPVEDDLEFAADPDPDYGRSSIADKVFPDHPLPPKKITQAVQRDIRGKVAMLLTVAGAGWKARDPYCGGEFLGSIPDHVLVDDEGNTEFAPGLASALTDIFIDSPDIVSWFTTSGKYMKYLTLAMVVQPLLTKLWAHHIAHSVQDDGEQAPQDWSMYATH